MMQCKEKKRFDIAIVGAGLSGVMLVLEMLKNDATKHKQILLLDKVVNEAAPRTWCFWEKGNSPFDEIISKQWSKAEMFAGDSQLQIDMQPYAYKMMKSKDFFNYAMPIIKQSANVVIEYADVLELMEDGNSVLLVTDKGLYKAEIVFDSRFPEKAIEHYTGPVLYQQFAGWFVRSEKALFDADNLRLMDFRMKQDEKVAFCYLLPISPTEALVEYTVFTQRTIGLAELEKGIEVYLSRHFQGAKLSIENKETGIIPMGGYDLKKNSYRIVPIGTAGGCTKPSSGYTFTFVRQHTLHIIHALANNEMPQAYTQFIPRRFAFYDKVLLRVLKQHPSKGNEILFRLFRRNKAAIVISFLHNVSTIREELLMFSKLPFLLFLKAAIVEWRSKSSLADVVEHDNLSRI